MTDSAMIPPEEIPLEDSQVVVLISILKTFLEVISSPASLEVEEEADKEGNEEDQTSSFDIASIWQQ